MAQRNVFGGNLFTKEMRGVMMKLFILRRIKRSKLENVPANPYMIFKEFRQRRRINAGIDAIDLRNEVYNSINSLERSGYIRLTKKIDNGRLKNYYSMTREGEMALMSARDIFRKSMSELQPLFKM